jgi:TonB-linked SusC/RagA family outer membrane protein
LVLIDGVPGTLDNVNSADIENISVLKDASSAAIYGARAANGVILVETRQGEAGTTQITYNGYVGFGEMQDTPRFADSWEYAIARNEALEYAGAGKEFTQEEIEQYRSGELPNDHHYEMAFDNIAWQTKHNLQISGGSEGNQYMFSVGYLRKDGLLQNNLYDSYSENLENWLDRYQVRLNVNSQLHDRLNMQVNVAGDHSKDWAPGAFTGDGTLERLVTRITRQPSIDAARIPAGDEPSSSGYFYAHVDRGVPWGAIDSENHENDRDWNLNGKAEMTYELASSLEITGRAGYSLDNSKYKKFRSYFICRPYLIQNPSRLFQAMARNDEMLLEALARYNNTFQERHEVNVIAGYSQTEHRFEWVSAYRDNFPNNLLWQLGAASSENQKSNGTASEWALQSYFMRANYSYAGKYLFEANARYDGSSRFAPENRFGLFPSFSAGWRVSEENFIQNGAPWIYNLKLRGSWGQLGNQQIGAYPYQASVSLGQNYVFGTSKSVVNGAEISTVANRDITWETTTITNVGVDFSILQGKLSLSIDRYRKKTSDILYGISTAGVLGMSSSDVNAGEVQNTGWDFQVDYTGSSNDFTYSFSPHFSTVNTEVLSLAEVKRDIGQNLFVGEPLNAIYGYKADGLFVDEQDIENYPEQPYEPIPGDIRYKDINGDGRVDADNDRTVIGQTSPKYTYGGSIRLGYNNLYLSTTFYGAGGMRRELEHYAARAFANGSNVQKWMFNNRWTPENPDRNALYPRMKIHGEGRGGPYSWHSTYWAWDASYLKIKSLQIGYNLPSSLIEPLGIDRLRIYASGRNVISIDNYVPGWDPELQVIGAGGGKHYPNMRVYSLGVNLQF